MLSLDTISTVPLKPTVLPLSKIKENLIDTLFQNNAINEDLQEFGLTLFLIRKNLNQKGLDTKNQKKDDNTYRAFIKIYDFIKKFNVSQLEKLAKVYHEKYIKEESKVLHINDLKRAQIKFMHQSLEYLVRDMKSLKDELNKNELKFIKENAFARPGSARTEKYTEKMDIFFNGLPSRVNSIEKFINDLHNIGSKETQSKIKKYVEIQEYL